MSDELPNFVYREVFEDGIFTKIEVYYIDKYKNNQIIPFGKITRCLYKGEERADWTPYGIGCFSDGLLDIIALLEYFENKWRGVE